MGYKRDGKRSLLDAAQWRQWRSKNNDLVAASGLPELVISDADHWLDFLDQGILDHHDDPLCFSVDELTVRQKAFLLQLVGAEPEGLYTVVGLNLIANLVQTLKQHYPE